MKRIHIYVWSSQKVGNIVGYRQGHCVYMGEYAVNPKISIYFYAKQKTESYFMILFFGRLHL